MEEKVNNERNLLSASWFNTELGPMVAIADEAVLYLLEFADRSGLAKNIKRLRQKQSASIVPGETLPIVKIRQELKLYFSGQLKEFKTPVFEYGSDFQINAWGALKQIPYGQTRSYLQQAKSIGNEGAFRAVANANGANPLAIIFPCHRVINKNGELGGYGGGVSRKQWLISHEKKNASL